MKGSVGVSKLGSTEMHFIKPCVKVNGAYHCDNFLAQKLLPDIFWISQGGFLSFSRTAHRTHDTVAFLERKVLDFISHHTVAAKFNGS